MKKGSVATLEPLREETRLAICQSIQEEVIQLDRNSLKTEELEEIEVLICRDRDITEGMLNQCPNLGMIFILSVGVDKLPFKILQEREILVSHVSGDICSGTIAEYVIGAILMFSCKFISSIYHQTECYWQKFQITDSLVGKNILIFGTGKIGRKIAETAKKFDMHTVGVSRSGGVGDSAFDKRITMREMKEWLGKAEYVVSTLPLTEETYHLFNAELFKEMNANSVLINISRGKVVCEQDLAEALNSGEIAGAVLDVFEVEPLAQDSRLWHMKNVLITPHSSGRVEDFVGKAAMFFPENLLAFRQKKKMPLAVDLEKRY